MANNSKRKLRNRAVIALVITVVIGFGIGIIGLVSVGLVHGKTYKQKAESESLSDTVISSRRGTIYDRNMEVMAESTDAWKVYLNPSEIEDDATAQAVAKGLSEILDVKYDTVYKACKKSKYAYVVVARQIDNTTKKEVESFRDKERGEDNTTYRSIIGFESDVKRYYPNDNFASTVLGFTGSDDSGRSGLEYYYDTTLSGDPGRTISSENAVQDEISTTGSSYVAAEEGTSLELTIDNTIQYYLDSALSSAVTSLDASYGYGIVMDTKTGAILAMSSQPDYNCNEPYTVTNTKTQKEISSITDDTKKSEATSSALYAQWRNRTITDTYEPGSVFKCVTASAGIEEGVVSPDEMFTCTGSYQVGSVTYHCSNRSGHGTENFTTSLMNSCNPIFIQVAQRLGSDTFSKYFDAFGFTETTGIDLPAEAVPEAGVTYYSAENMGAIQLASCSFGQSFQVSPIQMITAINAIGNDGKLMQPYVVDKYIDSDGNVIKQTKPVEKRQVVSKLTADVVTEMMRQVVIGGTAKNAYVPGYKVAGKTGTSEKLTKGAGYYIGSFAGFAPADDPQISVLIVIDEPMGGVYTGGKTAAPVAAEVIQNTLQYLNVEPEYTDEEKADMDTKTPNEVGVSTSAATAALEKEGFTVKVVGSGTKVKSQSPASGKLIPQSGVVVLYTDSTKTQTVAVPDLTGMTASQARAAGRNVGLNVEITGTSDGSASYMQSVSEGTEVALGSTVTVSFVSSSGDIDIEDTGNAD